MPEYGIQKNDWNEAISLNPRGYCEVQDLKEGLVFHGPIKEIHIDERDNVVIDLHWVAQMPLPGKDGFGTWTKPESGEPAFAFPNFMVEFVIEPTPEKGDRIRFGNTNIIYLDSDPESNARILKAIS